MEGVNVRFDCYIRARREAVLKAIHTALHGAVFGGPFCLPRTSAPRPRFEVVSKPSLEQSLGLLAFRLAGTWFNTAEVLELRFSAEASSSFACPGEE